MATGSGATFPVPRCPAREFCGTGMELGMSDNLSQSLLQEKREEFLGEYKDALDLLERTHDSLETRFSDEKYNFFNDILKRIASIGEALKQLDDVEIVQIIDKYIGLTLEELRIIDNSNEESIPRRRKRYLENLKDDFLKKRKSLIDAGLLLFEAMEKIDECDDNIDFRNAISSDTMELLDVLSQKIGEIEGQYRSDKVLESKLLIDAFLKTKTQSPHLPYIALLARYLSCEGLTAKEAWDKVDPKANEIEKLNWDRWHQYWRRYTKKSIKNKKTSK